MPDPWDVKYDKKCSTNAGRGGRGGGGREELNICLLLELTDALHASNISSSTL